MALNMKISKEDFDGLAEPVQGLYLEDDDGYALDVSGVEDVGPLRRAKQRESEKRKEAESRAREAEDRLASFKGDSARKSGDIETLEKSWQDKLNKLESDFSNKLSSKDAFIKETLIDSVAADIAGQFKSPKLMAPHIKARISADLEGDSPRTVVLDANGKPSALTVDELKKEFVANPDFSDMIIASKASGSGASTKNIATGGGAPVGKKDWSSAPGKEFTEYLKSKEQG